MQLSHYDFFFLSKIHWASKETCHFFRSTLTKIHAIKITHIWTQALILLNKKTWKPQGLLVSKRRKMWWNHERSFFENHKNYSPSELHGASPFRTFISYSFNFNGGLCNCLTSFCLLRTPSPEGKHFLWFWKLTSCDFTAFFSFLSEVILYLIRCAH